MTDRTVSRGKIAAIFVHCGAGFHSYQNEHVHLGACNDASKAAMAILRAGGTAVDAVEMAIKVLEDREVTNAGYGSNLTLDGIVEGDACIIDHHGRSGAVGAVPQIKNPISLARMVLDGQRIPLPLRRVPPTLLVAQGATDYAFDHGMAVLPHDALISPSSRQRWQRWKADLEREERRQSRKDDQREPIVEPRTKKYKCNSEDVLLTEFAASQNAIDPRGPPPSCRESMRSAFVNSTQTVPTLSTVRQKQTIDLESQFSGMPSSSRTVPTSPDQSPCHRKSDSSGSSASNSSNSSLQLPSLTPSPPSTPPRSVPLAQAPLDKPDSPSPKASPLKRAADTPPLPPSLEEPTRQDHITDTVGAIAIDYYGNIASGASSGGIGLKHTGRIGPAALVGAGAAIIPVDPNDKSKKTVATCTSGTGEQIGSTMAAKVCAERLYDGVKKGRTPGSLEPTNDDDALMSMIKNDFMSHPSVKYGTHVGAFGVLAIKKTTDTIYFYYAHNTDSFAVASQLSHEESPSGAMSRNTRKDEQCQSVAIGGRAYRFVRRPKKSRTAAQPTEVPSEA